MSSSRPRKARAKAVRCFECGKQAMRKARSDCRMSDGTVIRKLPHWHCSHCGEDLMIGLEEGHRLSIITVYPLEDETWNATIAKARR